MAAVQHRATTRTSNTDNSTTKTKSKATSARKSPATKRKRVSAETARAAAALKGLAVEAPAPSIEANEPGQCHRHRAQPARQGNHAPGHDLRKSRPRSLDRDGQVRRAQRSEALGGWLRGRQASARRMDRDHRRLGRRVRLLAARRPHQGACDGRRGQRTQFRCRVAGPLGRNPGHRPDRTRSQDLGEGR